MRLLLLPLLVGCAPTEAPPPPADQGTIEEGPERTCEAPVDGFERFTDVALERGIDLDYAGAPSPGSCSLVPGALAARDLDGDGAVDLLFQRPEGFPYTFWNDGSGRFEQGDEGDSLERFGRYALGFSVVDLDGDGLPEIAVVGASFAAISRNLGGRRFGPFEVLWQEDAFPRRCINSMAWGDADGDGDLDLVLPTLDEVPYEGAPAVAIADPTGAPDLLLIMQDGAVEAELPLQPAAGRALSVLAVFTDRDGDGDSELLVASDRGQIDPLAPTALYQREALDPQGHPILTDRAPDLGLDLPIDGMGVDARDVNGDGELDYCFSDVEFHLSCVVSAPDGYLRSGAAMGLQTAVDQHPLWPGPDPGWIWSTWGLDWVDLDNDGLPDLAVAGGPPPPDTCGDEGLCGWQPDALFRGVERGRFEDRSLPAGFSDPTAHYGLASADLSGDGYRELVVGTWAGRPLLLDNPCGAGGWVEVTLRGPPGNRDALGARVTLVSDVGEETQQTWSLRAVSQGPRALHFGLGDAETAELDVLWPNGLHTRGTVHTRRAITVTHPLAR